MSIRLRVVEGRLIALCAARSIEKPGDRYLDDAEHHALAEKFAEDFQSEGYNTQSFDPKAAALRAQEESNNPNREWWDSMYANQLAPDELVALVAGLEDVKAGRITSLERIDAMWNSLNERDDE